MEHEIEVCPSRLKHGQWCHQRNKQLGEGDISASYSADRIGSEQPVRRPFMHEGQLWVCTGSSGRSAHGYRLVHPTCFEGDTFTYSERVRNGEKGRCDPKGFYHGMLVKHAGKAMVLCGPENQFVAGIEKQPDLFGF